MTEDYEGAVAAIRDARTRGHALTGSLRLHIGPIDQALRARAVSVRRLAEDLGENRYSVRDAVYRIRHEQSATEPGNAKPATNTSAPARASRPALQSSPAAKKSGLKPAPKNRPQDEIPDQNDETYFVSDDGIYICRYGTPDDEYPNGIYRWYRDSGLYCDVTFN